MTPCWLTHEDDCTEVVTHSTIVDAATDPMGALVLVIAGVCIAVAVLWGWYERLK